MTHRTSLEVLSLLQLGMKGAENACQSVYKKPGARDAHHLVAADYADAKLEAQRAIARLQAAIALMDSADTVQWVGPDGRPERQLLGPFVYNRHGERVAVSIPTE